jgi:hypothetical protein
MTASPLAAELQQLLARCRNDPAFQAQLLAQPRDTLAAAGITLPEGVEVRVLQSTADKVYLPVPPRADTLSDDELSGVAGGVSVGLPSRDPRSIALSLIADYVAV